jgi:ubiquitin carboxyl-terminal hydrolase 22/27/51
MGMLLVTVMETLDTRLGLANIGNTCFMNVILQMLRLCPAITDIFLRTDLPLREASKKKELLNGFQTLIRDFWRKVPGATDSLSLYPRGFFQALNNTIRTCDDDWYRPGQQADATEAFQYILEGLHDAVYRTVSMNIRGEASNKEEESQMKAIRSWVGFYSKEYSPIINQFYGQTQIRVVCKQCGNVTERYEPWLVLKAPIPGGSTPGAAAPNLDACIHDAFKSEELDDYSCDTCKTKTKAMIHNRISRFPPFLCLSLKRFTNNGLKVRCKIDWNLDNTDFSAVGAFDRDPFGGSPLNTIYTTVAVVEHWGSLQGGHYRMYNRQGKHWYNYDDSSFSETSPADVVNADSYMMLMIPTVKIAKLYTTQKEHIEAWRRSEEA